MKKEVAEALVSEATNKFIERVLAWRLPDRARLDGPEGDERALENPPGARHGEIGGSHGRPGGGTERGWGCGAAAQERRRQRVRGRRKTERNGAGGRSEEVARGGEGVRPRYRFLAVIDPINDGALSDAFATGFNTPAPTTESQRFAESTSFSSRRCLLNIDLDRGPFLFANLAEISREGGKPRQSMNLFRRGGLSEHLLSMVYFGLWYTLRVKRRLTGLDFTRSIFDISNSVYSKYT